MPLKSFLALSAILLTFSLSLARLAFKLEASSEPAFWLVVSLLSEPLASVPLESLPLESELFLSSMPSVSCFS